MNNDRHFAITTRDAILYQALVEVFSTHRKLQSFPNNIIQASRYLLSCLPEPHAIAFLVLTHRGIITGRFALIHNHQVDLHVMNSDYRSLLKLAMKGKNSFTELYNGYLDPSETSIIERLFRNEYEIMQCVLENSSEPISFSNRYEECRAIYSRVKDNVSPLLKNKDRELVVIDSGMTYYFDVVELSSELSDNYSLTVRRLTPQVLLELRNRLSIQIKLVQRYKDWLIDQDA